MHTCLYARTPAANLCFLMHARARKRARFQLGVPVLGICYGLQEIVQVMGGEVEPGDKREYGHAMMTAVEGCVLFEGCPKPEMQVLVHVYFWMFCHMYGIYVWMRK